MQLNAIGLLITTAIFHTTLIAVAILLIFRLFKVKASLMVQAVNITLLLGSLLFTMIFLTEFFIGFFSGAEYVQYSFAGFAPHPSWLYPLIVFISYVLMPQIFWIEKFRTSITSSAIIILIWIVLRAINLLILESTGQSWGVNFVYKMPQIGIYAAIVTTTYLILNKRRSMSISKMKNS
ncbi:hypothetical protein AB6735_15860 [Mucilaginibacter sp. RCC_168]|uniref:hypothetical protein n=1 Tax=Mucilaginibacter sp. RCC_168 TaxID=3239221 RepID=UPI00352455B2